MRRSLLIPMVAVASISLLTACSSDDKPDIPESLIGNWYQTNSENGIFATASVYPSDSIQINLKTRDGSSIYWMGSFQVSDKKPTDSFTVVSKADPDALAMSIFGSQDSEKTFSYKDGDLSYKFTMLGTTSTVHLSKHKPPTTTDDNAAAPEIDIDIHSPSKTKPTKVATPKPFTPAPQPKVPVYKSPTKK